MKRLSDPTIERYATPKKETWIFDSGAVGLALKLTPGGRKVWISWLKFPGAKYQSGRTLGHFPAMKVAEARVKADLWSAMVKQGVDPSVLEREERAKAEAARAAAQQHTFSACAESWIAGRQTKRQAKADAIEVRRALYPALGKKPISEITTRDVRQLMAKLRETSDYGASRCWGHLNGIFKKAVHDEIIATSPMASLDKKLVFDGHTMRPRDRVLSEAEILCYWRGARRLAYPYGPFFQLLLLTGARLNEIAQARWSEVHPEMRACIREASRLGQGVDWATVPAEHKTLTIPAERFKSGVDHTLRLSDDACRHHRTPAGVRQVRLSLDDSPVTSPARTRAGKRATEFDC